MARSLADWFDEYGKRSGLRRVVDTVRPADFEATAIAEQLEDAGAPPILFEKPTSLTGEPVPFRLLVNAYGSIRAVAGAIGLDTESRTELLDEFAARTAEPVAPQRVDAGAVQTHRVSAADVDLRVLPWVRHVEGEGGPYFTPILAARGIDYDRYNLSWNRMMYLDPRHAGIHISPRQLWAFQRAAEEAGQDLPVAVVLGHHPAFNLAAASLTPVAVDEYDVAGALLGEPLAVTGSVSFGDRLLVPADAEAIIEGRLLAGRRAVEGPFGEYMRYLGPQKLSHVFEADAITWRDQPVVCEIFAAHSDHFNAHLAIHASLLAAARSAVPQVRGVAWFDGGGPTTVVISLAKSAEGQPMRAALAVIAASNVIKQVIVVDPDIDIDDSAAVMWAMSTRVRAENDVVILPNLQANLLDPSQIGYTKSSGFVIDATWPLGTTPPPVATVPATALASFPLDRYMIEET